MRVLVLGGTGLISTGILKHLRGRGAEVTMFNRGKRAGTEVHQGIEVIQGDRNDFAAFERQFADRKFDVVIDMIGFNVEQVRSAVRAFAGRCRHYIFCSTVCTYGSKIPPGVLIDETFPQQPISDYGRNKVACERIIREAGEGGEGGEGGKFAATIIRPSHTYGPGGQLIDNLESDAVAWDRIEHDLPVLCAGDGLGLWQSTHRDDVGKLFAFAAMNPATFGQSYNATGPTVLTWRDYYRIVAAALGKTAKVIFIPAEWIVKRDPRRFGLLREITQFHGAYDSSKARRDVPEFQCEISLSAGAAGTLESVRQRGTWRSGDAAYQAMVDEALKMGVQPVEA